MKNKFINQVHLEGYLYDHDLVEKVSGNNSKNPGTPFITGTIHIATDNAITNVVPVHFTYVTAQTKNGTNATYTVLRQIINGEVVSYMQDAEKAVKLRVDSSINLNEFYTDRSGKDELVSTKRVEGGFVHITPTIAEDEKLRNTFECDMLIIGMRLVDADPEKNLPAKAIIKGGIFDFRKAYMPVEFSVINEKAIAYFESLGASTKQPVFTRIKGRQFSSTVVQHIEEESAFDGEASVREVTSSRKDWVIFWAQGEPYLWDDESTITAQELTEALSNREIYLADIKKRQDEYKANKSGVITPTAVTANSQEFKF